MHVAGDQRVPVRREGRGGDVRAVLAQDDFLPGLPVAHHHGAVAQPQGQVDAVRVKRQSLAPRPADPGNLPDARLEADEVAHAGHRLTAEFVQVAVRGFQPAGLFQPPPRLGAVRALVIDRDLGALAGQQVERVDALTVARADAAPGVVELGRDHLAALARHPARVPRVLVLDSRS